MNENMIVVGIIIGLITINTLTQAIMHSEKAYRSCLPVAESRRAGPSVWGVFLLVFLVVAAFLVMEFFA